MSNKIHIIVGPTASGKTGLTVELARQHNGLIINADRMQLYQELPLLTAMPSPSLQEEISHRLFGTLTATEDCTAADWSTWAAREVADAQQNGYTPIIVGGTGFYIKALLEGLSNIPPIPAEVRAQVAQQLQALGIENFYLDLLARDPLAQGKLNPNDTKRISRAYEVLIATGKSLWEWQENTPAPLLAREDCHITVLNPPRDTLRQNITHRAHIMLEQGVLDEVAALHAQGFPEDAPIFDVLGYRVLRNHLLGLVDLETALTQLIQHTSQYAKKQQTWFTHQIVADEVMA